MGARDTGFDAEQQARKWLEQQGLVYHDSNWHCRLGEIDLIMKDSDCWVFVEVKFRSSASAFGGALLSVTPRKQRKLLAAAGIWLSRQRRSNLYCRFDVLAMELDQQKQIQFQWIPNAFMATR